MEAFLKYVYSQNKLTGAIVIVVTAYLLSLILKITLDFIFRRIQNRIGQSKTHVLAKTQTVKALLKNVVNVVFLFVAGMMLLAHFGYNIVPLLTGAGILGLAFSFGAQTLFKNMIAGFFIITEDQFNIGDRVKIKDFEGTVHKMTLRMTVLKDAKGNLIYISNSQIENVTRFK